MYNCTRAKVNKAFVEVTEFYWTLEFDFLEMLVINDIVSAVDECKKAFMKVLRGTTLVSQLNR